MKDLPAAHYSIWKQPIIRPFWTPEYSGEQAAGHQRKLLKVLSNKSCPAPKCMLDIKKTPPLQNRNPFQCTIYFKPTKHSKSNTSNHINS